MCVCFHHTDTLSSLTVSLSSFLWKDSRTPQWTLLVIGFGTIPGSSLQPLMRSSKKRMEKSGVRMWMFFFTAKVVTFLCCCCVEVFVQGFTLWLLGLFKVCYVLMHAGSREIALPSPTYLTFVHYQTNCQKMKWNKLVVLTKSSCLKLY